MKHVCVLTFPFSFNLLLNRICVYVCALSIFSGLSRSLKYFLFQALSGVGEILQERARITKNSALTTALNTQFLFQIGVFTAVPMVLGVILEQGFLRVITCPIHMFLALSLIDHQMKCYLLAGVEDVFFFIYYLLLTFIILFYDTYICSITLWAIWYLLVAIIPDNVGG